MLQSNSGPGKLDGRLTPSSSRFLRQVIALTALDKARRRSHITLTDSLSHLILKNSKSRSKCESTGERDCCVLIIRRSDWNRYKRNEEDEDDLNDGKHATLA